MAGMMKFGWVVFLVVMSVVLCSIQGVRLTIKDPCRGAEPLSVQMIECINQQNTTWTASENQLMDMPLETVRGLLGELPPRPTNVSRTNAPLLRKPVRIPTHYDVRNQWAKCKSVHQIRNQGLCGSCWAISTAAAISDRVCIASETYTQFIASTEDILECCADCGFGCGGGWTERAFKYWVTMGVVSGGEYNSNRGCMPYEIPSCADLNNQNCFIFQTPPCEPQCRAGYRRDYLEDKDFGTTVYTLAQDPIQIQRDILRNGPVVAIFQVFSDFYNYQSGVYQHVLGGFEGLHAVKVLGWGEENGVPYWLIANSWGTSWGDRGFVRFLRGSDHCDIESSMVSALP